MGEELIPFSAATLTYSGQRGKTRRRPWHIGCECGLSFVAQVHEAINLADGPDVARTLLTDQVDRATCPHCGRTHVPELARTVHDPRLPLFVLWLPPSLRSRELELRAELLLGLAAEPCAVPEYVKSFRLVFGAAALRSVLDSSAAIARTGAPIGANLAGTKVLARTQVGAPAAIALEGEQRAALLQDREALQLAQQDLAVERAALRALAVALALRTCRRPAAEATAEAQSETGLRPLTALRAPAIPSESGWGADGEAVAAGLDQGRVVLALRSGPLLSALRAAPPRVLVQLHRAVHPPLIVLAVFPGVGALASGAPPAAPGAAGQADGDAASGGVADRGLCWFCDPGDPAACAVVEALAGQFVVEVDLYDEALQPLGTWRVAAPLAENVAEVLRRTRAPKVAGDGVTASLAEARASFLAAGGARLAGGPQPLGLDAFLEAPSPAAARLALGIVGYWAEAPHEERLLWEHSFPLREWDALRLRVVAHAQRYGLLPSAPLLAFARDRGVWGSTGEVLPELLERFARVSRRQEPSDLDPLEEWENWRALFSACQDHELPVDAALQGLAVDCARRAQARSSSLLAAYAPAAGASTLQSTEDLLLGSSSREQRGSSDQALLGAELGEQRLDEQDIVDQEELLGDADIVDTRWLEDRTPAARAAGPVAAGGAAASESFAPSSAGAEAALVLDVRDDDIVENTPVTGDAPSADAGPETH
ncbi:MAG: hypothetical protein IPL40_15965 [Proteobacteria bacterium]|nr:hypothetical protein [Pseudomonadota bacterium]